MHSQVFSEKNSKKYARAETLRIQMRHEKLQNIKIWANSTDLFLRYRKKPFYLVKIEKNYGFPEGCRYKLYGF